MTSRADRYAIAALIVVVIGSWAPRFRGPIDLRWDAGAYYILGTALAEGRGYRLLNEPGEIRASLFPPLLPAIVALHQRAIGSADPVVVGTRLRLFFFLLFAAFVGVSYALLRRVASAPYALGGTLVASLTFLPVWLSDRLYTDLPFALACVVFVLVRPRVSTAGSELRCWLTAAAAFLLRTAGAALFVAWVAESLLARDYRRTAVRVLLALVPILGWQIYVQRVAAGDDYRNPVYAYQRADYNIYNVTYGQLFSLRDHLNPAQGRATYRERAWRLPEMMAALVPGLGGAISARRTDWEHAVDRLKRLPVLRLVPWRTIGIAMTLLGVLVVMGVAVQLGRRELRGPVTMLAYIAALCSMPPSYFNELPRYLVVISPLCMMSAFRALSTFGGVRARVPAWTARASLAVTAAMAAIVLSLGAFTTVRGYTDDFREVVHRDWRGHRVEYRLFTYGQDYEELDRGLEWLEAHASPGDVVASTTPQWVYVRTGLRAVMPPFEPDGASGQALIDSVPVRFFVVADWLSRRYALPTEAGAAGYWRKVYSTPHCTIYERLPK
jgi:hypothetical protein